MKWPESRATFTANIGDFKEDELSKTIIRNTGGGGETQNPAWVIESAVYESHPTDSRITGPVEQCPTVAARWGTGGNNTPLVQQPICLMDQGGSVMQVSTDGITGTLLSETHGHQPAVVVPQPVAMINMQGSEGNAVIGFDPTGSTADPMHDMSPTIRGVSGGNAGHHVGVMVPQPVAIPLQDCRDVDKNQNGLGIGSIGDPAYTLDSMATQGVAVQQPVAFTHSGYSNQPAWITGDRTDCLSAGGHSDTSHQGIGIIESVQQPMAFTQNTRDEVRYINGDGSIVGALAAQSGMKQTNYVQQTMAVRRLTPVECERLQGFPDNYTAIAENTADSSRYKALGNSMSVNVMHWIGLQISLYFSKRGLDNAEQA